MIELHIGWLIGLVLAIIFILPVLVWVSGLGIRNVSHQLDQESQNRREDIRLLQAIVTDMIERVDRSLARSQADRAISQRIMGDVAEHERTIRKHTVAFQDLTVAMKGRVK